MCGIYGVVNKKVDRELAMKCLNTMIHRGPDGYGLWQEDGVTLGHRRLSILDLSMPEASRCPMQMSVTG